MDRMWAVAGTGVLIILVLFVSIAVYLLGGFEEDVDEIIEADIEDRRAAADSTW